MSRGPGRLQRKILNALRRNDSVRVRDLLQVNFTHSQESALYRAAQSLVKQGRALIDGTALDGLRLARPDTDQSGQHEASTPFPHESVIDNEVLDQNYRGEAPLWPKGHVFTSLEFWNPRAAHEARNRKK